MVNSVQGRQEFIQEEVRLRSGDCLAEKGDQLLSGKGSFAPTWEHLEMSGDFLVVKTGGQCYCQLVSWHLSNMLKQTPKHWITLPQMSKVLRWRTSAGSIMIFCIVKKKKTCNHCRLSSTCWMSSHVTRPSEHTIQYSQPDSGVIVSDSFFTWNLRLRKVKLAQDLPALEVKLGIQIPFFSF